MTVLTGPMPRNTVTGYVMATFWVEGVPAVVVDGNGVKITLDFEDQKKHFRMSRATFRRLVEQGRRELDDAERLSPRNIINLRKP